MTMLNHAHKLTSPSPALHGRWWNHEAPKPGAMAALLAPEQSLYLPVMVRAVEKKRRLPSAIQPHTASSAQSET
jgi:hypothetical protein